MKKPVRRPTYPKTQMFSEGQKQIFKYNDGNRVRGIDPLDVSIALGKQDFDWEQTALRAKLGEISAVGEIVEFARKVFKLPEYEENEDGTHTGVTSQDVLNTLVDFVQYLDELKKNIEEPATSQPSMVVTQ